MARKLHDLRDLQREDAEAEARAIDAAEREFHRRGWFWRKLKVWTNRFEMLEDWAKKLGGLLVAVVAVLGVGFKLVRFISDRRLPPAQLPAPTGIASTTVDRVEKPLPPK